MPSISAAKRTPAQAKKAHDELRLKPNTPSHEVDVLVPDSHAAKEFGGVSLMTLWRWDRDEKMIALGWPPAISLRGRNHRSRQALEAFKKKLIEQAIKTRAKVA